MKYGVNQHSIEIQSTGVCSSIFTDHLSITLYVLLKAPVSGITGALSRGWDVQHGLCPGLAAGATETDAGAGRAGFQVASESLSPLCPMLLG